MNYHIQGYGGCRMELSAIRKMAEDIKANISKVLVGREETIELVLISLFCGGHVLLEDVPGVGKTMLAKCLAKSLDSKFKRVQFTPDLLPSDLTGINFFNQKESEFIFKPGPSITPKFSPSVMRGLSPKRRKPCPRSNPVTATSRNEAIS
jgi:MoxR-like ATPase